MSASWTGWSADSTTNSKTFTCFATGFSADTNFIIGGANDGVYRSTDGITWIKGSVVSATVTAVASNSDASFMCCTTTANIYYSLDQGRTWTIMPNLPSDTGYTSICCGGRSTGSAIETVIQIVVGSSRASGSSAGSIWTYAGINATPVRWSNPPTTAYVTALVCTDNALPATNYFVCSRQSIISTH